MDSFLSTGSLESFAGIYSSRHYHVLADCVLGFNFMPADISSKGYWELFGRLCYAIIIMVLALGLNKLKIRLQLVISLSIAIENDLSLRGSKKSFNK